MTVDITEAQFNFLNSKGLSKEKIQETVNNYRDDGLSDDEIQDKLYSKIESMGFDPQGQRKNAQIVNSIPADVRNIGELPPVPTTSQSPENVTNLIQDYNENNDPYADEQAKVDEAIALQQETDKLIANTIKETGIKPLQGSVSKVGLPEDILRSILSHIGELPRAAGSVSNKYLRPLLGKQPLSDQDLNKTLSLIGANEYNAQSPIAEGIGTAAGLAPYLLAPELTLAEGFKGANLLNQLGTGIYQGGIAGFINAANNNENIANGIGQDALIGGVLGATGQALKLAGELSKPVGEAALKTGLSWSRIPYDTFMRAIEPNSKALDLSKDEARYLLRNTTSNLQKNYADLLQGLSGDVEQAVSNLGLIDNVEIPRNKLEKMINDTFSGYSEGGRVNSALNLAGREKAIIGDLLNQASLKQDLPPTVNTGILDQYGNSIIRKTPDTSQPIRPIDLHDIKKQIGEMTNWADENAQLKNNILEQLYGKFNSVLNNISPAYKEANKPYELARKLGQKEGLGGILNPAISEADKIDSAGGLLKNMSGFTRANREQNLVDLEKYMVNQGYDPFINNIQDVNAAELLNKEITTGSSIPASLMRELMAKPILKGIRGVNSLNIQPAMPNYGATTDLIDKSNIIDYLMNPAR